MRLERHGVLFRQGDPGDGLYVVINGRLEVLYESEDGRTETEGPAMSFRSHGSAESRS